MKSMEIFTNYCSSDQMTALGLKTWLADKNYFSPDILNEQITIVGEQLARSLLEDIRKPGIFSLLADEAADVCNKEQLCVCIR